MRAGVAPVRAPGTAARIAARPRHAVCSAVHRLSGPLLPTEGVAEPPEYPAPDGAELGAKPVADTALSAPVRGWTCPANTLIQPRNSADDPYMFCMPKNAPTTDGTPRRPRRRAPAPELAPDLMQRRADYLAEAVRQRRALQLRYGGAWRVVHPHALGRTGTGRLGLLTWQTAGVPRGRGDGGEGWRMFDVARIEDAELLRATFTPRARAARKGWTPGIARPTSEVPSREEVLL